MSALAQPRAQSRAVSWPRLPAALLGVFITLAGGLVMLRPALDPDLGWHLRTGQLILATHSIPTADPYSFTRRGAPWVEHEWLWQVAVAVVDWIGGHTAIVLANGAAVALVLALIYLRLRDQHVAPAFAAAGTGVALTNLVIYAEARPGTVVAVFSAIFLFAFERYKRTGDWRWLALAPASGLLWANMHGSYILGLLLCGVYGLASLWESRRWRSLAPWLATFGACAATSLLNPLGMGLYRFTLGASQLSFNRQFIFEWQPPDFRLATFAPVLATLGLLLAVPAFFRVAPRGRAQQLLLVAGSIATIESQQFILFFAVVAAPAIGDMLDQAFEGRGIRDLSAASGSALGLALLALALMGPATHLTPAAYRLAMAENYPVDAVDFVERQQLQGPMWNEFDWGGYLIGALPRVPVFADGRTEMYGNDFELQAAHVGFGSTPPGPIFEEYGINFALVKAGSALATELQAMPGWREAYRDKVAAVYVREAA